MENINEIVAALAIARGEFPLIEKTETATIKGKTKAGVPFSYNYDYAPLAEILDKTAPVLSKNGLALIEAIDETESGTELTVLLAHSSGQYLSSRKLLGSFSDPKLFGGAMTYYRRYLIEGLLNIASQQDKDGQGVESEVAPKKQPQNVEEKSTPFMGEPVEYTLEGKTIDLKQTEEQPTEEKSILPRPWSPEYLKGVIANNIEKRNQHGKPSQKQINLAGSTLSSVCAGDDDARHELTKYLVGKSSVKDMTAGECSVLIDWTGATAENEYQPKFESVKEFAQIMEFLGNKWAGYSEQVAADLTNG